MSVVLNGPSTLSLSSYALPNITLVDAFAASNPGNLALNLWCDHGLVAVPGQTPASGLNLSLNYANTVSALANISYTPPNPPVTDTIYINVWDQAGDNSTKQVTVQPGTQPQTGVQAYRIADLLEPMGVNTFSSLDTNNVWGSWPADYSPNTTKACLAWLTGNQSGENSGLTINIREYHYSNRETMQAQWFDAICPQAYVGEVTLSIGANGSSSDVASMINLASVSTRKIKTLEGINEPNTNFGSGTIAVSATLAAQLAVWNASSSLNKAGPSIVFGLPFPEGYITPGYINSTDLSTLNNRMTHSNAHIYPPTVPDMADGSGRNGAMDDIVVGMNVVYPSKPCLVTEWHPTLYNTNSVAAGGSLDAYYTPLFLLSAHRLGIKKVWWYALHDYGSTYDCGLFQTNSSNPRPGGWAIRAMYRLTGDTGATKRTFTPGKLDYSVSGLPGPINTDSPHTGGQHRLFQNSAGVFFLFVWNAQVAAGGTASNKVVTFNGTAPASVKVYDPCTGSSSCLTAQQTLSNPSSVTMSFGAGVRLLVITK